MPYCKAEECTSVQCIILNVQVYSIMCVLRLYIRIHFLYLFL